VSLNPFLMIDTDKKFMERALSLASRGAGLTSPNPMVGAVLVNGGRVVGEGFHRYDRLRHAESYAIEMAGELARGATLYCSLEPCCHHGRTPPCTDGLIEAGIARAVIAARDPDSRVAGQGIDQLRAAGIKVEVGLCERETLRQNEAYFKYITTGLPFLHSVVGCADGKIGLVAGWKPSPQFLNIAGQCDMLGLGPGQETNEAILNACHIRERHRQLIVCASNKDAEKLIPNLEALNAAIIRVEPATKEAGASQSDLALLRKFIDRLNVTSMLALPGFLGIDSARILEQSDKTTVIVRHLVEGNPEGLESICPGIMLDVESANNSDSVDYTELTGYPRRSNRE
jgi:pyrimidine deaminase RibD-like protein